jgi:hypothetical protein
MLQRLDEHFRPHDQELNRNDYSRGILLQEAIQNNDSFYLVLSQVFCLYTVRGNFVVHKLGSISELSWSCLKKLLCSNESLSLSGVRFFSTFPAAVENILLGEWSRSFLDQLEIVKRFLLELPYQWDSMRNASITRRAPPLTHEMVEVYNLVSPVIQTTVFRALARSFWGPDDPGLKFLLVLHKLDQDAYTKEHWKRTGRENTVAYGVLRYVYDVWQEYRLHPQAGTEQFMLQNADDFFRELPPSMQPTTLNKINGGSGCLSRVPVQDAVSGRYGGSRRANNSNGIQAFADTDNMGVDTAWCEG